MNEPFYDVIDENGEMVKTAFEQKAFHDAVTEADKEQVLQAEKQLTDGDKRKLRKLHVTVKQARVLACGHRLDLSRHPRHRNCQTCWWAFFQNHRELNEQLDEMHNNGQDNIIVALQGVKFLHRWRQFMSTLATWVKQQENNEQSAS